MSTEVMSEVSTHTPNIKQQVTRSTKARDAIMQLLARTEHVLSVPELLEALHDKGVKVNKTTVYREIESLRKKNLVRPVQLSYERVSYELMAKGHHHHFVCVQCEYVEEIDIGEVEGALVDVERHVGKKKNFSSITHSLEFFGTCADCVNR